MQSALSPSDVALVLLIGGFFIGMVILISHWVFHLLRHRERIEEIEESVCDLQDMLEISDDPFTRKRIMREIDELMQERRELLG
jgi:hypothetical protein